MRHYRRWIFARKSHSPGLLVSQQQQQVLDSSTKHRPNPPVSLLLYSHLHPPLQVYFRHWPAA